MNDPASPHWVLLTVYSVCILLSSLAGGWIPFVVRLTHTRLQIATSLVAGLMLGVGVLHMIPHAWYELRSIDQTARWLLAGFLLMFFLQRFFHFHHHDVPDEDPEGCSGHRLTTDDARSSTEPRASQAAHEAHSHQQGPACAGHDHGHAEIHHDHTLAGKSARHLSWAGAALGLTLHTLIDGVALAASVAAGGDSSVGALGVGTFLVVLLHKPFDAMVISTLMTAGGWSRRARHLVNALFALAIPVGILLFHFGLGQLNAEPSVLLGSALAFAGGVFLCIATSDLLPELQFHSHDRGKLSMALLLGLGLAALIGRFETTGHDHLDRPPATPETIPAVEEHDHAH